LWKTAIQLQHEGRLNLLPLITDQVPFDQAPALFDRLDRGDPAILQSVLEFEGIQ
jgi:threonine dehydrogenase-like Zn-dependent dehydrogenase